MQCSPRQTMNGATSQVKASEGQQWLLPTNVSYNETFSCHLVSRYLDHVKEPKTIALPDVLSC